MSIKTPYQHLLEEYKEYVNGVRFRDEKVMWCYTKETLGRHWSLTDLWERTAAADQLGYAVELRATDEGLKAVYKKKLPSDPWRF